MVQPKHSEGAQATVSRKTYYLVTAALMVLLVLTFGLYYVPLGAFSLPVAMAVAFSKAALIVLFFMHVRYSSKLTKVVSTIGIFILSILFLLTFSDYLTRAISGA